MLNGGKNLVVAKLSPANRRAGKPGIQLERDIAPIGQKFALKVKRASMAEATENLGVLCRNLAHPVIVDEGEFFV